MSVDVSRKYYGINELSLDVKTPFDEVEPMYNQVCRLINSGLIDSMSGNSVTNCPTHFVQSLIYLVLPTEKREEVIGKISKIVNRRRLYRLSMDELLSDIEINELLQRDYNIDSSELLRLSNYQQQFLYRYFYEGLYEVSLDNYLGLKHTF
jgi:hypothetical protein